MAALQQFFDAERKRRGWSVRETADRASISVSKAYAIVNGDDNVEFETFENIASAFGMTPAELANAIGKGRPEDDPDEIEALAIYRQVPPDKRATVKDMLRGLAVPPVTKRRKPLDRSNVSGSDQNASHDGHREHYFLNSFPSGRELAAAHV